MNSIAEYTALGVLLLTAAAEWLHRRRSRRLAALAFGPSEQPRRWTNAVPFVRAGAMALLAWGLVNLYLLESRALKPKEIPEGGYRHMLIALDVSPSMQLRDAGPTRQLTRMQRAGEVLNSMLERIMLDQVRVSVVAFYTGAKPVVVDTYDLDVVKNILNDLPLDHAFQIGKTTIMEGLREAFDLAKPWQDHSTTLIVVSDGDSVPDTGMPQIPKSISKVLVVGVGDTRAGKFIDGHQSRQDASTLRQVALRLRGVYHDGNEKHLPSEQLMALAKTLPMQRDGKAGRREFSVAAVCAGAVLLVFLPVALALGGSLWKPGRPVRRVNNGRSRQQSYTQPWVSNDSLGTCPDPFPPSPSP